jgi:hypothetical protein
MMLNMVHDRAAIGVNKMFQRLMCTAMWKANIKTATLLLFWIVSAKTDKCQMLHLETKQSGGILLHHSDPRLARAERRGVSRRYTTRQELQQQR